MGLKDRIRKIKRNRNWSLSEEEKTGVVNGLVLIGAVAAAFFAVQKETEAAPTDSASTCESGESSSNMGIVINSWQDHCWWDHCWHNWSDSPSG